jgi:hypothetical protein
LHQDKKNTRRGQTKRKKTKEKTWTTKKIKTQGLHLQEKKHKRFIKERRNTKGHYLSIHPLLTITIRHQAKEKKGWKGKRLFPITLRN